ncbi:MAG TPA: VIT domain-containing protein [Kofleriaceae bacterium]|nr:VIT domain-containing protein [Kofleriaceae bacterium]
MVSALLAFACTGTHADPGQPGGPPPRPAPVAPRAAGAGAVTQVTTLFVASHAPPGPPGDLAPPWSLTASDGSGLQLTRVDARAVVEGPLAFTELHLYFHNPEARTREGTFAITLPERAAVSRFAMESDGRFLEAEVVEKQRARQVYEDFLHRRQDPALLEKAEGNQFTARVFPIAGHADKHLVVSYSQEVDPGHYTLPLRGLARSQRIDVRVQVRGKTGGIVEQTLSERDWTPDRDAVVDATSVGAPAAIAAGELAAARVRVELPDAAAPPASVTLLVDTSASRALGFAAQARAIHQLVDELARDFGGALPVQVVAFDQGTAPLYDGRADRIGNIEAALAARGALGASDLGQALRWLADHAPGERPAARPGARIVVVTDGVITAGPAIEALPELARGLAARGVDRIDVALTGGIRDGAAAAAIARAGLAHPGAVLDLDRGAAEVARRIGLTVRTEIPVTVDGARWAFPTAIDAAQAGDEVTVFARRDPQAQQLALTIGGVRAVMAPVGVTPVLLGRAVAAAEIAELDRQLAAQTGAAADRLRGEILQRSIAARVVSSQTSMLVLESDADYARYGIDRTALADILAIGPAGIELLHRAAPPVQIAVPAPPAEAKPLPPRKLAGVQKAEKQLDVLQEEVMADRPEAVTEAPADAVRQRGEVADLAKERAQLQAATAPAPQPAPASPPAGPASEDSGAEGAYADSPRLALRAEPARPAPADPRRGASAGGAGAGSASSSGSLPGATRDSEARADRPREATARPAPPAMAPPPPPPPPRASRAHVAATPQAERGAGGVAIARGAAAADGSGANDDGLAEHRQLPALRGPLADIERMLAAGSVDRALAAARVWHDKEPGDVLALIGLGDALEVRHDLDTAARVYGSIIDLYPARADFRRFAGERLERVGKAQRALIIDTYRRAVEQRPDHLTGHRLLAYALVRDGQYAAAFTAILDGIDRSYPANRFAGAERVLAEDVGMIGAAYLAHVPARRAEVIAQLDRRGIALPTRPSTRFLLYWETDGNDVDFHIRDARGGHAWYGHRRLRSGGELYADITTGYGPECFAIPGTPSAGPYRLSINYFSQGPMGYGMGLLQVQTFDGRGNLGFEDRPYVIMTDQAFVDLGTYR